MTCIAALRILSTSLTAAEKIRLAALTARPIPLQYYYASQSKLLIEPATGMIVDMVNVVRGLFGAAEPRVVRGRAGAHLGRPPQPGPQKVGV